MVMIFFHKAEEITKVEATVGDTLLKVAQKNNIELFGGCDGAGVCGTCHIYLESTYMPKIEKYAKKTDEEMNILEGIPKSGENSRLACQVVIQEDLEGMRVILPS